MSKKAMSEIVLVSLIAAVVGLIIMGWAVNSIVDTIKSTTDKEACRASVELKAQTILGIIKYQGNIPLKCNVQSIEIKNTGEFKKVDETIANAMYDCWYQFGEGKIDFLNTYDLTDNRYCFLCNKISFDDSIKNKNIVGLDNYLKEQKIGGGSSITYADYFYTDSSNKDLSQFNNFNTNKPLYILYYVDRNNIKSASLAGSPILGCAAGAAIGVWALGFGAIPLCIGGAVAVGYADYTLVGTDIKLKPFLLVSNSENAEKTCSGGP